MFDEIKHLSLEQNYELDVYIKIDKENPIKGQLFISQNFITLKIYNTSFNFEFDYKKLICEYHRKEIELINLESTKYSTDFYSQTKEVVFNIEKLLFKESCVDDKYKKLIIRTKDINQWIGFTNLQRNLGFEINERLFNQHRELLKSIDCAFFKFNIFYEINTNQDTFNGTTTYTYLPYIELDFNKNLPFNEIEKVYYELLNLFNLLLGFNLDVEEVVFQSDKKSDNNSYYYYKKDYKYTNNRSVYIALANDLFEQYRKEFTLNIFKNYFKLCDYQKSYFMFFRKYKSFHYSEEKFLGYFRILENIMYQNDEKFTKKYCDIYLKNINLSKEEKTDEEANLKGEKKNKSVIDKPMKGRKSKIKFIVFHNQIKNILSDKNIIVGYLDVEKIVDLRNDISHLKDYYISQNDLEKYIDYLELLTIFSLLKLIGYSEKDFVDNLFFYQLMHKVFQLENN